MSINEFQGEYRWLSNFWPVTVEFEGTVFPTVEHAYQAAKTSIELRHKYKGLTAGQAKRLGRVLPVRNEWEQIKLEVMRQLIRKKFAQGTFLAEKLKSTGDVQIIEGNVWGDTFWGVCRGIGQNNLGKIIMAQRDSLIREDADSL